MRAAPSGGILDAVPHVRSLLATLLPVVVGALLAAAPADAASFTVTTLADGADDAPADGVCRTHPGGPCSLRAALASAQGNGNAVDDTIVLPPGELTLTLGELLVLGAGAVDVLGAGAGRTTIRQTSVGRVFHATAPGGRLRLVDLTVRGGRLPASDHLGGAGIRAIVGLELDGVVVYDNQVADSGPTVDLGGGVAATGGSVRIARSTIARNAAPDSGGGLDLQAADVTISDSLIVANAVTAPSGTSGGLSVRATGGAGHQGRIVRTTIADNRADGPGGQGGGLSGGGRVTGGTLTPFVLEDSLVRGNLAGANGGGWLLGGSTGAIVRNSTFSGNRSLAPFAAGAIEKQNGTQTIELRQVTLSGNANAVGGQTLYSGGSGAVRLRGTIVDGACLGAAGGIVDLGGNLETGVSCGLTSGQSAAVGLGPLSDHGGPTPTHAIAATSPANHRLPGGCAVTDQRGAARTAPCDSGAYEREAVAPPVGVRPPALPDVDGDGLEDLDDVCPSAAGPAPDGCPPPVSHPDPLPPLDPSPPGPGPAPGPPPGAPVPLAPGPAVDERLASGLVVARASLVRGHLSLRGSIARAATGRVRLRIVGGGRSVRLTVPIRSGRLRLDRRLPRAQRRLRSATVTLDYAGSRAVRPDRFRLRAARRSAGLRLTRASRSRSGRLLVAGRVGRRIRGRVAIRIEPRRGTAFRPRTLRARIARGGWRASLPLRGPAATDDLQLTVLFPGDARRGVAGGRAGRTLLAR